MKTAADRIPGRGKTRQVNARFAAMVSHYLFEAEFCDPASGWEKGQIEKNVQDSRHRVWLDVPACQDLAALNDWLETRCRELWQTLPHPQWPTRTIAEVWREEQPHLVAMPVPFDGFVEQTKRVTPTCLVHVERNRYNVPASFANRPVSVRLYAARVVFAAEGQVIAEHRRRINRSHDAGQTIDDWRHYRTVVQRKPEALRNGAPFAELPEGFRRLQAILLKRPGGDREMVEILALVLQYDEQAVLAPGELALEAGAPSKPHVLNLLARLTGETPPAPLAAPPALALKGRAGGQRRALRHAEEGSPSRMTHDAALATLRSLRLHGMAQALDELAQQDAPLYHQALPVITTLLKAKVAEREVRSVAYQLKAARFPVYRDLAGFDFHQSPVDEALVRRLHDGAFMHAAHNVVLVGGPGTGKTQVSIAARS